MPGSWKAPSTLMNLFLPVNPLANRMVCMVASVPVFTILSMSIDGNASLIIVAISSSMGMGAPYSIPFPAWALTASTTSWSA